MVEDPARSYRLSAWLFLRILGLVYLVALVSFWVQLEGLVGSRGVAPASGYLTGLAERLGTERFFLVPTLAWMGSGDLALHSLCAVGVLLALLLLAGVLEVPSLLGLWAIYLSLVTVGQEFMSFQWDVLLLETGLLAVFLFPPRLRARPDRQPSPLALFLFRWLLFRLFFSSGVAKLTSGDETWRQLTALHHHYETQPLPTWVGWWAHQLPGPFHSVSVLLMFAIELLVPFLVFGHRWSRRVAVPPLCGLMLLIALTGNYCFFNLLSALLCLFLVDDALWPERLRGRWPSADTNRPGSGWWSWALWPYAALVMAMSTVLLAGSLGLGIRWPEPVVTAHRWISPWRSINRYGLFAVMTTERREIVIEGSLDGEEWRPYELPWKPGDLEKRPRFVAPHQPRLDWQMWFAALGTYRQNPWFVSLLGRLGRGSPAVLELFETNPFPDRPPRYLRARLYRYRFSTPGALSESGVWWQREPVGEYFPQVATEDLIRFLR